MALLITLLTASASDFHDCLWTVSFTCASSQQVIVPEAVVHSLKIRKVRSHSIIFS